MKKLFAGLAVTLVIILVVAWFILPRLVHRAIESEGSAATGAAFSVETVQMALAPGRIDLGGLTVSAPGGSSILESGLVRIVVSPTALLSQHVIIDTLVVSNAAITIRQTGNCANKPGNGIL
jgi:hypothetical protein